MAIEIRPPAEDELRAAMEAAETAFGAEVSDEDWERQRKILPAARALVAYDDGRPVGLAAAYAFELSIPGGELPCAGVTWVGVISSHRRRGILRDFMRRQLADAREWGEPIAALWASEASIYGRFGYGPAVPGVRMKSDSRRFAYREEQQDGDVAVRMVDTEEAFRTLPAVYDRVRATRAGMLSRSDTWWKDLRLADPESWRKSSSKRYYAVFEVDGEAQGYASYRIKDDWEDGFSNGEVRVVEAFGLTPEVELAVWKYLHEIDLTVKVDAHALDPASRLVLNVLDPRALGLRLGDALWLRLVDLDRALRERSYGDGASVVLDVTDELCPWNAGRYRVGEGAGRTEDAADLALDTADLAAVYLGAFDVDRLAYSGRVRELTDGAVACASLLFRTPLPPYCPEVF